MNYTLHQLQVFLKVTKTKSITKAAVELHLSQPAVSIQLKNFQDQFDVPLTEIIGRTLYVTDFGKEIAIAAENILNEVYAINYKTVAFKGKLSGRLKIAVVSTGKYIMPYFLTDFLKENKEIELEMDVTNKSKVIQSLLNNETDFALVSVIPKDISVFSEYLLENKLFMFISSNVTQIDEKDINKLLTEFPLIYREEGSSTRMSMEKYISSKKITPKTNIKLASNEAVKQAVLAGIGVSLMPLIGVKNELENNTIKIIPLKEFPILSQWNIIWLKNKKLSPVANAYIEYIQKEKEIISNKYFSWNNNY